MAALAARNCFARDELLSFIVGESEMAGRIRAHPWKDSELGPPEGWPDSLKTLVSVMLAANQQMYVVWGPGQLLLYNDRYIEVLQGHHADALGRPFLKVWSEIENDLRPLVEKAYAGIPSYTDDIILLLERNGYTEETHFAYSYTPVFNASGRVDGFFCPCIETTAQVKTAAAVRESEKRQRLLLAELQHRVRNTLAVIRSITRRTAETTSDKDEMLMHLSGRIDSFARVQAAVTRDPSNTVDLAMLIAEELRVAGAAEGQRLRISGPAIGLAPKAAETLGLAIHELTTNAIKYGALTAPEGRLVVNWAIAQDGTGGTLNFSWFEHSLHGLPDQPTRKGMGTEILTRTVPYELKATSDLQFGRDGIAYTASIPIEQLRL